ncbi:MAG TPA: PH domain-containing protein [Thermoanaerobaculia bacterium]|nr:PH domain-containing protein [Thermoanaerobaculia bacterium]
MSIQDHLQAGEEVLYQAHPSRLPLVPPLTLAALVTAAGFWVWTAYENIVVTLLAGSVAVIFLLWAGWRYLVIASYDYVLTNRRILRQQGILAKASNDAYLDKINNVEHRQSLWGRLLGFGDVLVDTASETGTTVFAGIADPLDFKRAIVQAASALRVAPAMAPAGVRPAVAASSTGAERLRQLKGLLDEGLISAEEYEAKRRELLTEL